MSVVRGSDATLDLEDPREALKTRLNEGAEVVIEKLGEVSEQVLNAGLDSLPSSVVSSTVPLQGVVAKSVPSAASVINPVIVSSAQKAGEASVESLRPRVNPCVTSSVDSTKKMAESSINKGVGSMPDSLF